MQDGLVNITVIDRAGESTTIEAPTDMGLSLMEFLKGSEYDILATCGGMALCATCCVDVMKGGEQLPEMEDAEAAMLDTLPDLLPESRLSCQLRITEDLDGIVVRLHGSGND